MNIELEYLAGDVLGLPRLAREVFSGEPGKFGLLQPRRAAETPRFEETLDRDERKSLTENLTRSLSAFSPHVSVLDSLRRLEQPGASVVLGTIQLGPLGGSVADMSVALQTLRAAQQLDALWETPVVPMVWIDSDANAPAPELETWLRSADYHLERVRLNDLPTSSELASARGYIPQLLQNAPEVELELKRTLPLADESASEALARATLELFGAHGLLVVCPDWVRTDAAHFLARILSEDPAKHVAAARTEFEQLDLVSPLEEREVFVARVSGSQREPLFSGGDGFCYDDEPGSRTCAELAAEVVQDPAQFVAGARLLPLVQDHLLPVAARIVPREAFPDEALLASLRAALGTPRVAVLPRVDCTLVDEALRNSLARLGRTLEEVYREPTGGDPEPFSGELQRSVEGLRKLATETSKQLHDLARPLWGLDPVLRPVSRRAARELREAIYGLNAKAERVLNNRTGKFGRHRRIIATTLLPSGQPQQETDPLLAWTCRFGTQWLEALLAELDPFAWEHVVVNFP